MTDVSIILNEAEMTTASKVFTAVLAILLIVAYWKIFQKAGEPGWKSIIPLYSSYTMYKMVFSSGWFFLLELIPVVGFIIRIVRLSRLSRAFGHGIGFTLGLIFLPNIFTLILGFNQDEFHAENVK